MTIRDYCKDKRRYIIAYFMSDVAAGTFLWLIEIRKVFIMLIMMIWLLPFVAVFLAEFYQKKKYYDRMEKSLQSIDKKTLLAEVMEPADFYEGELLYEVLQITNKYVNDTLFSYEQSVKEYKEYVEMWVHEVKTPITVLNLLFSNHKNAVTAKMEQELRRIDALVEQSLYYARSTSVNRDFQVKKVTLQELVDDTLKQHARELIHARATIDMSNLDEVVYADSKWICFILGQIVINAIKYKKEYLHLTFFGEHKKEGVQLKISDNGIGICEKDLSRVFEKGFTGENGRMGVKSTGIGLYLCKKLCLKMNLGIEISSIEGTCVTLTFPVNSILEELKQA